MKIRPLGKITDDLEPLIEEMVEKQEMQMGEILYLIYGYLMIHYPSCIEEYEDGSKPNFNYG